MSSPGTPVRIYVGTNRSQEIAFRVLGASIRRRTQLPVEVHSLGGLNLPEPPDPAHRSRTGFSFARFAIPELAGRTGRALYLDADMLVLKDIAELWTLPLGAAKVACQEELPDGIAKTAPVPGARRRKQCSVMVLDCARLEWDAAEIIAGLGPKYTYEQLLEDLCILSESEISYGVSTSWNSLEHADETTCLLHYTDMMTQPWVHAGNPNGWLWSREVRDLIAAGEMEAEFVRSEIVAGYVRPSMARELALPLDGPLPSETLRAHLALDRQAGYRPHASLAGRSDPAGLARRARRLLKRLLGSA
ncbi:MAG: glycosyltransferase [Pannonibacter sp.]